MYNPYLENKNLVLDSTGKLELKNHCIGDIYQGGVIFYIFGGGTCGQHGLICSQQDVMNTTYTYGTGYTYPEYQGSIPWGCTGITISGTSTDIGTGLNNTNLMKLYNCSIVPNLYVDSQYISLNSISYFISGYTMSGYTDWYIPSKDELEQISIQRNLIGNFPLDSEGHQGLYWSSSQFDSNQSWIRYFNSIWVYANKNLFANRRLRPIRTF